MAEGKGMDADDAMAFTHIAETAVSAYADASFSRVRQADGVLGDFLAPVSAFDFSKLAKGDGKGGNLMGFTPDKRFIVKEMSGDDHASLLQIAGAYVDHVLDPAGSLLCHFYAHFAYEGKNYVVMNNLLTDPPGTYTAQYDLKGCADDKTLLRDGLRIKSVHKRFYNPKMWFGKVAWSEGRRVYHKNKVLARTDEFHVTGPQYVSFVRMLERDCAFLAGHNLMDYSLLVGVQSKPIAEAQGDANIAAEQVEDMVGGPRFMPTLSVAPGRLAGAGGEAQYLSVGIIDFLQDWNIKKKIARKFKVLERNKATIPPPRYGARFASYFGDKFVADSEPLELVREPAAGTAGTAGGAGRRGARLLWFSMLNIRSEGRRWRWWRAQRRQKLSLERQRAGQTAMVGGRPRRRRRRGARPRVMSTRWSSRRAVSSEWASRTATRRAPISRTMVTSAAG